MLLADRLGAEVADSRDWMIPMDRILIDRWDDKDDLFAADLALGDDGDSQITMAQTPHSTIGAFGLFVGALDDFDGIYEFVDQAGELGSNIGLVGFDDASDAGKILDGFGSIQA